MQHDGRSARTWMKLLTKDAQTRQLNLQTRKPAFNWWVPHILKKRDRIISLLKKRNPRYLKRTHKFGIEVPKTVKEALELDKKNGNTLWANAIANLRHGGTNKIISSLLRDKLLSHDQSCGYDGYRLTNSGYDVVARSQDAWDHWGDRGQDRHGEGSPSPPGTRRWCSNSTDLDAPPSVT